MARHSLPVDYYRRPWAFRSNSIPNLAMVFEEALRCNEFGIQLDCCFDLDDEANLVGSLREFTA